MAPVTACFSLQARGAARAVPLTMDAAPPALTPPPPQSRTLNKVPAKPEDLPTWNYDGSSTGQVC
jgi:hypothetical protein